MRNNYWLYIRLLTELNPMHTGRSAQTARLNLQDVLCRLREWAAKETETDPQEVQGAAEELAFMAIAQEPGIRR